MVHTIPPIVEQKPHKGVPISGILAIVFGLISIVFLAVIFVPLGTLFSLIALVHTEWITGFLGLVLSATGFFTSPIIMGFILPALGIGFGHYGF